MNRETGRALEGIEHLRQSIIDILTTPYGSRLERRTYGSLLPELLDHPDNLATRVRVYAATAVALMRWEPRLRLSRILLSSGPAAGQATLDLTGEYLNGNAAEPFTLRVTLPLRAAL